MATTTPRIGLTKPDGTDLVDIAVLNTNFDKIDSNIASTKIQATKPSTANAGDLWWDSDTGTLYLYYTDANSSQWVAATSDPINIGVVANQTERDAQYPTPAQGMSVYRTDLGVTQRYYGLFNSSTNPGGRDTAGWYNEDKSAGFTPVVPTSVVAVGSGATATVSSIGVITASEITSISLNGVFSSKYSNYRIIFSYSNTNSTIPDIDFRLRSGGTDATGLDYQRGAYIATPSGLSNSSVVNQNRFNCGLGGYQGGLITMDISNPFKSVRTFISARNSTFANTIYGFTADGAHTVSTSCDGFSLILSSGAAGTGGALAQVYVYGYNEK